jgi:hypothetical protein
MRRAAVVLLCLLLAACTSGSAEPEIESEPAAATPTGPIPPGQAAVVGDYEVTVLDVPDIPAEEVLAENPLNDPPPAGSRFLVVRLAAAFVGQERGHFNFDTTFEVVGPDGTVYGRRDAACGYVPDDISYSGETFPGERIEGNACRIVPDGPVDGYQVRLRPLVEPDSPGVLFLLPQ